VNAQPAPGPPVRAESYTWPLLTIVLVILPQVLIPPKDRVGPSVLVPIVEAIALAVGVIVAALPGPVPPRARPLMLSLFAVLIGANTFAAARLVFLVLGNDKFQGQTLTASRLLMAGLLVLTTNVVTFGLVYWQLDGGGPAGRVTLPAGYPDFSFPQTVTAGLAAPTWSPHFGDHLYLAFTNVVAFSPTDTMPLTLRAKGLMALQSMISLSVLTVVLARVINLLPG
jgi:hypothetical protein